MSETITKNINNKVPEEYSKSINVHAYKNENIPKPPSEQKAE